MSRHRAWCFTINNFSAADWCAVKYLFKNAKYGICAEEVGKAGTPHLQGYIHLSNALSLNKMKKYLVRAHLIVAMGSDEDNQRYCKGDLIKDGDVYKPTSQNVYEVGQVSVGQGFRTDIKDMTNLIRNGEITLEEIMWEYPELYTRYNRVIKEMFAALYKPRTQPPEVYWRWGLAGTGKTRWVIQKHGAKNVYIKDGTSWWDGYKQQDVILIDDFDNNIPYRTFLRIIDRYHEQGQVKGGYVSINSPYIFITCEHPPEYYWIGNELQQVLRRITSVEEIK